MNFETTLLPAVFAIGLLGFAQNASALSSARATVEWNTFDVQLTDLSGGSNLPVFDWLSYSYDDWSSIHGNVFVEAYTTEPLESQTDFIVFGDWSEQIVTAKTSLIQSSATRSNTLLQADTSSFNSNYVSESYNGADARASTGGAFRLSGHGIALLTWDWSVVLTADSRGVDDYSNASISIVGNYSDGKNHQERQSVSNSLDTISSSDYLVSGTFVFSIFSDGVNATFGSLAATTNAYSYLSASNPGVPNIPIPGSAWLFGSGLLVWIRAYFRSVMVLFRNSSTYFRSSEIGCFAIQGDRPRTQFSTAFS